jgi:hypothetical protein
VKTTLIGMSHRKVSLLVRFLIAVLALETMPSAAWAGDEGGRAKYIGGTLPDLPRDSSGSIITTDADYLQFQTKRGTLKLPYQQINMLEYGQKVGRRVALALALAPVCTLSPLLLLAKTRRHYLTITYTDGDGREQAAVFQLDKDDVRMVLAGLEARTGLKVAFQDDETRKGGKG